MSKKSSIDLELFFSALADRTRLRLLNLMRGGEVCVCFFAGALGTNNPKISRHLSYLKRSGLVEGRRDGKWMHYRLIRPDDPIAADILDKTLEIADRDEQMMRDTEKLAEVCCVPVTPVGIVRERA